MIFQYKVTDLVHRATALKEHIAQRREAVWSSLIEAEIRQREARRRWFRWLKPLTKEQAKARVEKHIREHNVFLDPDFYWFDREQTCNMVLSAAKTQASVVGLTECEYEHLFNPL